MPKRHLRQLLQGRTALWWYKAKVELPSNLHFSGCWLWPLCPAQRQRCYTLLADVSVLGTVLPEAEKEPATLLHQVIVFET